MGCPGQARTIPRRKIQPSQSAGDRRRTAATRRRPPPTIHAAAASPRLAIKHATGVRIVGHHLQHHRAKEAADHATLARDSSNNDRRSGAAMRARARAITRPSNATIARPRTPSRAHAGAAARGGGRLPESFFFLIQSEN
ncbi:hypothetical protein F511_44124 [Dorcoceras hygrometricum]|uniref:Uncharacterized protein n=1 Tax=Dorcoceras hygrometricum TaxID=472368 RepID=A0A2Z7CQN5_9LAMI|nr:hypothetical protein F511_44124 [Dorcoceras hygrometricum]